MKILEEDEVPDELIHIRNTGIRTDELYRNLITFIVICRNRKMIQSIPGYRSRGPGSIPGTTRFSEK
jgi:hypothetical protein